MPHPNQPQVTVCAAPHCGQVKKQTNHWYLIAADQKDFICTKFHDGPLREYELPVCGQGCAAKMFQRFLEGM